MNEAGFLARDRFASLLDILRRDGRRCVAPQLRDGAIVYDTLAAVTDLPLGRHDIQEPGRYRIEQDSSPRWFAWANGSQALRPLTFAPSEPLWRAARADDGRLRFEPIVPVAERLAVIGVRACDLAALALQDQHFLGGPHADAAYRARRERLLLIAVHCTRPAATCFCASTGDGPRAGAGADIALHELDEGFIVESGSELGAALAAQLALGPVTEAQRAQAGREIADAAGQQRRTLPARNLRDALFANLDHPRWEEVASRCLACGNCTAVCPTCFCHAEMDEARIDGGGSMHLRLWDSCFTRGHSYIHGLVIRADRRARYRQWLTHKLGSWHDQYGRNGCVGCGRCITWCPVGIDITEEAAAITSADCGVRIEE